jgi:hypothetical protein
MQSNLRSRPPVQSEVLTVSEFCNSHRISHSKFYEMLKAGYGPRIMKVGRRTLISVEAATAWRRRLEESSKPSGPTDSEHETG